MLSAIHCDNNWRNGLPLFRCLPQRHLRRSDFSHQKPRLAQERQIAGDNSRGPQKMTSNDRRAGIGCVAYQTWPAVEFAKGIYKCGPTRLWQLLSLRQGNDPTVRLKIGCPCQKSGKVWDRSSVSKDSLDFISFPTSFFRGQPLNFVDN